MPSPLCAVGAAVPPALSWAKRGRRDKGKRGGDEDQFTHRIDLQQFFEVFFSQCFELFFRRVSTMPMCAWFRRHDQLSVSSACSNANDPLLPMRLQSPRPRRMIGCGCAPRARRQDNEERNDDQRLRSAGCGTGERGRRSHLRRSRARKISTSWNRLRHSKIELVLTRHEQAAAFMAATHGRLTGRPGVCLSTLGPGALNFTTAAAYAASRRHADADDHRARRRSRARGRRASRSWTSSAPCAR